MADVGRSTSAHDAPDTARSRHTERWLWNWGAWIATLPPCGPVDLPVSPMFRAYIAGYRQLAPRRAPENVDVAERLERVIAALDARHVACLICRYVLDLSARRAARLLIDLDAEAARLGHRHTPLGCGRSTYLARLEEAITRVERDFDAPRA